MVNGNNRNKTVLIVGGLRGDDVLGPTTILNLYGKIKAARIIYFPIANPSGFMHKQAETYPNGINVEADFPLWGNKKCNMSSSIKALEYLFRTYQIDLSVYIHEGTAGVTHSWTSKEFHLNESLPD